MSRRWAVVAGLAALLLVAGACGKGGGGAKPLKSIGPGEGQLNLIAWGGYVEDGSNDPAYDWVTQFEKDTGCQVKATFADSSDEMVRLMRQGGGTVYDGVSTSGDASNRLIVGGDVAEINVDLMPDFANVIQPLQAPAHNTVDGKHYGVPYMYGVNFLMYNKDVVTPAPTSWDITFEANSPYKGKITAYDVPIFIADAAVYLKTHRPELKITDPYELTDVQLSAAVDLLKQQKLLINKYWSLYTDEIDGFADGSLVAGTAWPINLSLLEADGHPVDQVVPSEGVTGWADTWMMSSHAKHPNCMYKWMQWTMKADVQSQVALWYGAAGSNVNSCALIKEALGKDAALADTVRYGKCGDVQFLKSIYLWKTPQKECGDDRGATCVDYSIWQQKWTEIRGA
jgi:putative spermidine/putrescine transport system substrate-binding protein